MGAEISGEVGAALGEVAPDASQRVAAAGGGDAGRGDRAVDPAQALGLVWSYRLWRRARRSSAADDEL
jgi:hypothetical protein